MFYQTIGAGVPDISVRGKDLEQNQLHHEQCPHNIHNIIYFFKQCHMHSLQMLSGKQFSVHWLYVFVLLCCYISNHLIYDIMQYLHLRDL